MSKNRTKSRRAHLYLRISRDESGDRLGVARQEKALREHAVAQGWDVVGVYCDNDISAHGRKHRPEYATMLEAINPGDVILVTEQSRLARHPRDLEDLVDLVERQKIDIHALRAGHIDMSTSGGRAIARILGAIDRQEGEIKSERLKAKFEQNAVAGKPHGGKRAYGYQRISEGERKGERVVDEHEATIVRWLVDQVLDGATIGGLVNELNAKGEPTTTDRPWVRTTLRQMLMSPTLAGLRTYKGEVVGPGNWPAIITREQHELVKATMTHGPNVRRGGPTPKANLLTGLVRCSKCGSRLRGNSSSGARSVRQYTCPSPSSGGCGRTTVTARHVETIVLGWVRQMMGERVPQVTTAETDASAVIALEAEMDELLELRTSDAITLKEFMALRAPIAARLDAARAAVRPVERPVDSVAILRRWDLPEGHPEAISFEERRMTIASYISKVTIMPGQRGRRFDPHRVLPEFRLPSGHPAPYAT